MISRLKVSKTLFRFLLSLMVLTQVASTVISFAGVPLLPPALGAYVRSGSGIPLSRVAMLAVGYGGLLLATVAVIGLFFFWKPARALIVAVWVVNVSVSPLGGITVQLPLATTFDAISGVLAGMVIALVFFSPVSDHFESRAKRGATALAHGEDPDCI